MKSTYIWPILFLIFGVSEQLQTTEDCDEDEIGAAGPAPAMKQMSQPVLPKNNLKGNMLPANAELHYPQPKYQYKKPLVRKTLKPLQVRRNRLPPTPRRQLVNRRQQRPMNLVIKPIIQHPKTLEAVNKRKFAEYYPTYPFKKQKRILLPAFDEYETYPDTDYIHEVVIPETRGFDYMENSPYNIPCDPNAPPISTEIEDYTELAREMGISNEALSEEDSSTTSEMPTTEKEPEVTTLAPVDDAAIETRNDSIPIHNLDEPLKKFLELFLRGILALISCIKSRGPMFDNTISKLIDTALQTTSSCNLNKA